ncbi:hypothetical protein RO3G_09031 [Rhizopus delemar RA 99-880]|uniref:J domain-containing protein n=1 Tax=Rhizopus delemar (strain RA 99-880 / ATCC MYA-4621 / FGSC 9543 / NRRL 43880) TaxID=246409 RepID=I1C791_RHIO9|nr:hypothetical protein RO3G_09031 [Rhizopus delemar RA 99-880]|eukprot:EIE84321.1 hypothetical protein RO3G_09031 [Rhizopus delemar RA 99-880]
MRSSKRLLFAFVLPFFINHQVTAFEKDAKFYLEEGNQYLSSGKFNDAILSYDTAIQQDPSDYLSYYKRATAYLSLGKTNSAIDDFSKILSLKPGFHQALLQRAKLYVADGEYSLAKQDLESYPKDEMSKLLLSSIGEAEKSSALAQDSFSNQNYEQCIQHISRVIKISPQRPQWRTLRAQCHLGKGEIEEAVNDLTRVSHLNPSDQALIMQLAKLNFYSLYEPDRALAQVKQCLHYDPEQKQCKTLFRQMKRFQKDLQKVMDSKQQQRFATAFNTLVGTVAKKGLVSELDEPFDALETDMKVKGRLPKKLHLTCFELACQLAAQQKDTDRINTWCSATLKIDPNNSDALASMGENKLNNNDFEGAVHDLEKAYEATGQQDHRIRQLLHKAQQLLRQSKKRDYYKILDVSRDADPRAIKKAYRKKAQEWHPDKYSGDLDKTQVENKMAEINQAYEVLSDPEKKEQFDNGFDPYDPEAGSQQQHNPFNFHGGGDHPFAHFGGGDEEETEPLHAETIEMSEPGQNAPPLYRQLGRMAEEGWTSVANLVNNHPIDAEPSVPEIKNDLKRRLYLLLEEPSSSHSAFWTNVFVSLLIVFSAVTTTIETIPAFRSAKSNRVWFQLESAMVALFTLEYLLRMFAHSDSLRMLKRFFLCKKRRDTYEFRFTILRLFRLLRLFKSYKYSNTIVMTIEVMMMAFRRSGDALSALFFFTVTCVVLFSTLLYFAERGIWDETLETFVVSDGVPSSFDSIPAAFWFVLVTITTTGYGDMVPTTFIGKLITFPAMMFGVLLIALPSIIVGRNFTIVWESMRQRQFYQ